MKKLIAGIIFYGISSSLLAAGLWEFENRIAVTTKPVAGVFHHLEGSGRKHIAVSAGSVALVWEDDHRGEPQIYITTKPFEGDQFSEIQQVSSGAEAYEPAIVATFSGTRFVLAWEQDGAVYVRSLLNRQLDIPQKISFDTASHVSLASTGDSVFAIWREQKDRRWSLWVAALDFNSEGLLTMSSKNRVESETIDTPVLFPAMAANDAGLMLAWEDRQSGHTRLKYSFSTDYGRSFSEPQYLNEFFSNRNEYDKGNGVTRVTMNAFAEDEIVAGWMDKRRGGSGYGIFASLGSDDSFGPNEKVHGLNGDKLPHYNPATSGNKAGDFVVAWDDYRLGDSDIWISTYNEDDEWSKDYSPEPASGEAEQTHVSVALDEMGGLHLFWIERQKINAPTQLWYSHGKTQ